ncbi:MAG TPA: ParB N-terminal domain-containing protein [Candidatus Nanoarchaeia archaeon]|nr:ParB N-terminal domain-containing protein [Candidatus Nanoarchaeia archaeon]
MSLRINLEYERMLPKMSEEEFSELKASIKTEGQHYAIVVNEDLEVLDGHHRYRACTELCIEPDFEVRKFDDKLLEKKFVIEANIRRRHLNNFQLVELAVPLMEIEKAIAKNRQVRGGKNGRDIQLGIAPEDAKPEPKGKTVEVVAKRVGLSPRTLERGKRIIEDASEEDKQKLREGKVSIAQIYREVVAQSDPAENMTESLTTSKPLPDPKIALNKARIEAIIKNLREKQMFCPSCGNAMFECSKCHKTLQDLLK